MLTESERRSILVRAKARNFATDVKVSNMALKVPDALCDFLKDDEIPVFFDHLRTFGLQQRPDKLWEPTS